MHVKCVKLTLTLTAIFLMVVLFLSGTPAFAGEKGDILVHLRLYEGSRGNEILRSSVVSSYYLKPLFVSSMVSEFNIREEKNELKMRSSHHDGH